MKRKNDEYFSSEWLHYGTTVDISWDDVMNGIKNEK